MRLLKQSGQDHVSLTRNLDEDERPQYAILSHTWVIDNEEEVSFAEIETEKGRQKEGYNKIRFCAEQAKQDETDHFWVDTCCINKGNLTELSEAINSMYKWYQEAYKCYVYLSDVSTDQSDSTNELSTWQSSFRKSR